MGLKNLSQLRAESEFTSLVMKRDTVEMEKTKILEVIEELEIKKKEATEKTHHKVDHELNEIVVQVLPGSTAELVPVEGKTVFDGLELQVSFSNVRKGLQELSGGQRSLIALALVLALLKFKPAPFYILDEIDAALDLNHTQNIGRMLRQSFKAAQFVIVSLKDGMWNNANVVFRTSFRDSNSQVQRTVNQHP
jgi:structural maintenance of chromosome 2